MKRITHREMKENETNLWKGIANIKNSYVINGKLRNIHY